MEPWEFELEFLMYDEFEKKTSGNGSSEEFEVDNDSFQEQLKEFIPETEEADDWEPVEDGEKF